MVLLHSESNAVLLKRSDHYSSDQGELDELQKKYRKNENFVYRMIQHETILVPIKDNVGDMDSLYNLNEVGAFVWERLDGEKHWVT